MRTGRGHERFVVTTDDEGAPLDRVLSARIPELSRRRARMLLEIRAVRIDGARVAGPDATALPGQVVEALVGGVVDRMTCVRPTAEMTDFRVLHEDADVCVVDKPSGLPTESFADGDRPSLARELEQRAPGG